MQIISWVEIVKHAFTACPRHPLCHRLPSLSLLICISISNFNFIRDENCGGFWGSERWIKSFELRMNFNGIISDRHMSDMRIELLKKCFYSLESLKFFQNFWNFCNFCNFWNFWNFQKFSQYFKISKSSNIQEIF